MRHSLLNLHSACPSLSPEPAAAGPWDRESVDSEDSEDGVGLSLRRPLPRQPACPCPKQLRREHGQHSRHGSASGGSER